MMIASTVSAVTGVILLFWIPHLLSVNDFGYWRTFLLYTGYAGFLHCGMVDGALLDWSRPVHSRLGSPFRVTLRALALQHVVWIAIGLTVFFTPLSHRPYFKIIGSSLLIYALLFNLLGLLQVHLQSRLNFPHVAFSLAAPGVFFLLLVGALRLWRVNLETLLAAYLSGSAITSALLWRPAWLDVPITEAAARAETFSCQETLGHIRAGWPIMLAATGYGLMQSADRMTVNLTRPIGDFAIYSLSQSTIYVPISIITAVSRVAFSHFATVSTEQRVLVYRNTVRLLALLWLGLLPFFFIVKSVVALFLPRYAPGLPAGLVLLLSVLFLSLISIVQGNTFKLDGRQHELLVSSLCATAVAFASAWIGSTFLNSLTAVAWSQVFTAALWWLWNERLLRRHIGLNSGETAQLVAAFGIGAGALLFANACGRPTLSSILIYYGLAVVPTLLLFRKETKSLLDAVSRSFRHLRA